jgi:putative ABC transport system ATP-binding protein
MQKDAEKHNRKIIELVGVSKWFVESGGSASGLDKKVEILEGVDLDVFEGEKIAIVGPSGSGKSTILSLIAGLDTPNTGEVLVGGKSINRMGEGELSKYRNQDIGVIFQSFELILPFTVLENVQAPQEIKKEINKTRVEKLLEEVSIKHKANSPVTNLSGGEKQRVAIARALANNPKIILADEPTGSLDRTTGKHVLELLVNLTTTEKRTLVMITHDEEIARQMDKIYQLKDKKLVQVK